MIKLIKIIDISNKFFRSGGIKIMCTLDNRYREKGVGGRNFSLHLEGHN